MKHSKPAFTPTFAKAKVNKQAQKAKAQHCCSCGCFIPFEQRNSTNACEKCADEMAFLYRTVEQSSAQITEDYRKEHPSEDWDDEAFNIISTEERQKIEAAYNKTAECQARYQRCLAVINTNEQFNNGKTRTRQWLEAITDTAERERCRTVLNNIITAKRLYAKKP